MEDCLFCKIISKEIKSEIVLEDDNVLAFRDINPKAPTHILVIPKKHIPSLNDLSEKDYDLFPALFKTVSLLQKKFDSKKDGYRTVINCGKNAGQAVFHLHLHFLAGRGFAWPPG